MSEGRCVRVHPRLGRCTRSDEHARTDCHYEDACLSCNGSGQARATDPFINLAAAQAMFAAFGKRLREVPLEEVENVEFNGDAVLTPVMGNYYPLVLALLNVLTTRKKKND